MVFEMIRKVCFLLYSILFLILFVHAFPLCTGENPYHHNNVAISYSQKEGFALLSSSFETLRFGGYLQLDGRFFYGENQPKSTFLVRKARIFMTGTLYDTFGFMLMPRWDNENIFNLQYAWLDTLRPSWFRLRFGLFKKPFSLEALKIDLFRNFAETSLIIRNYINIVDLGIEAYGELFSDRLAYSFGFFNGRGRELDNNNNKEMVGRLVYTLFTSKTFGDAYLGFSGAFGRKDEDLSGTEFVTETFTPFWQWTDNPNHPVEVHSSIYHLGMDFEWLIGSFYVSAEFLYTNLGKIHKNHSSQIFRGNGGYAEMTYILTGEEKPRNAPLYPKNNFDPCKDHWGAWEIAFRYEIFYASKKMIEEGFAKGANYLHGPQFGINWYLNPRILFRLDTEYLWFNRAFLLNSHHFRYEIYSILRAQAVF